MYTHKQDVCNVVGMSVCMHACHVLKPRTCKRLAALRINRHDTTPASWPPREYHRGSRAGFALHSYLVPSHLQPTH